MQTVEVMSEPRVSALLCQLSFKSPALCEHSVHVARAAVGIAAQMRGNGYGSQLICEEDTFIAGLLHDTGKLDIEDEILTKPEGLTSRERNIIHQHALWGYAFTLKIPHFQHLAPYVLQHHEVPGRRGYPHALPLNSILLMSRILNIADRFSGMLVDRPYRKAISSSEIIPDLEPDIRQFFGSHTGDIVAWLRSTDRDELEESTRCYLEEVFNAASRSRSATGIC